MRLALLPLLLAVAACARGPVEPRVRLLPEPRDPVKDLRLRLEPERHVVRHDEEIALRIEIVNLGPRPILITEIEKLNRFLPRIASTSGLYTQGSVEVTAVRGEPVADCIYERG